MLPETASHFEHGLADLVHDLAVVGEGLLGFRGELHVRAGEVNEDGCRPFGHTATTGLVQPVLAPVHRFDGFREQASALLVHQRDAIGKSEHFNGFVGGHPVAKDEPDFDLVGVALGDRG